MKLIPMDQIRPRVLIAFFMLCGLRNLFSRRNHTHLDSAKLNPADSYLYYHVQVMVVHAVSGETRAPRQESSGLNVRHCTDTDVWEVFRVRPAGTPDVEYYNGHMGMWQILEGTSLEQWLPNRNTHHESKLILVDE